ncbi:putative integral membrane protein (apicoplast) [Babesia bovis T2Bo]|uniref:Uncharacterized protein n=1 Tax=Babesia bovis TaxID=5865 RepID=A7AXF2_BABBO|nr:putative integral membrane protein [Babesia bovis T2Bo]EDO05075.1 putative integral membrane protein [Babesia bovis T2Bo]|eukprot:YP_002290855.1 hypothetical protein BBOV_V000200 (apicoplast) [Babesia bovis T2Bo]
MTLIGKIITLTKQDIKNYSNEIYYRYFNYTYALTRLNFYPLGCKMLIKDIIKLFRKIKFKRIFTLLNLLKFTDYILGICIDKLKAIKNYDVVDGVDVLVFFFEFLIDKYIYRLTDFQMNQKCQYSLRYAALWIRCFSTIEIKKDVHPFFLGTLAIVTLAIFYPFTFWAVISHIEKFNTLDNIYHYFISTIAPL